MGKAHIPKTLRDRVRLRAVGQCEYCKTPEMWQVATFHCDHCIPEREGGSTTYKNLAWACPRCNAAKAAETHATDPQTGQEVPPFNPRKDAWSEHFSWSTDGLRIVPMTPKGRATCERLQMNRTRIVKIRELLRRLGWRVDP